MNIIHVPVKVDLVGKKTVEDFSRAESYREGEARKLEAMKLYERQDKYGIFALAANYVHMARDEGISNYEFFKKYMFRLVDKIGK